MRTVVAVLRGGPSSEYDLSLRGGAAVLEALDKEKYEPRDIFIDRKGQWHMHGISVPPEKALFGTDVAFNAMHGHYGEDGQVQRLLDQLGVPYTGSSAVASAASFNKQQTKYLAQNLGVKVAYGIMVENTGDIEAIAHTIFRTFPHPAIIKPITGGFSQGTAIAENFNQLQYALAKAFDFAPQVLVEEYIKGRDATVGVIQNFRNESAYALLPSPNEILSQKEKNSLIAIAKKIHDGLGLSHYSESDFIVSKRGIYFLEVNTLPNLSKESLFHKSLNAVGSSLSHFIDHVIGLSRNKR